MKLLALVTDGFGAPGGIARYNRDFLTALAMQQDVDSIMVMPRNGTCGTLLPKRIEQVPPIQGKWLYAVKTIRLVLAEYAPDLIFCGHLNQLPLAWLTAKLVRAPLWLQLHGTDAWNRPKSITGRLVEKVNLVTCVSRHTRRQFLSWANIAPSRVKILPNTVSEPANPQPKQVRPRNLGIDGKKTVLTVGRLCARECYKGHDRIIACLPRLLEEHPNLSYLIAGDGDDRKRLEALAVQHGVSANVNFLGNVSDEQLAILYTTADLFAMPSTGEGFGIVFLEAMAAGTPALGLDCDGSVDPLQDGNLGMVAKEGNLCEALSKALRSSPPRQLVERVHAIFGQELFQKHVHRLLKNDSLHANGAHGAPYSAAANVGCAVRTKT